MNSRLNSPNESMLTIPKVTAPPSVVTNIEPLEHIKPYSSCSFEMAFHYISERKQVY